MSRCTYRYFGCSFVFFDFRVYRCPEMSMLEFVGFWLGGCSTKVPRNFAAYKAASDTGALGKKDNAIVRQ
jgi:hypothetical protein